MGLVSGKDRADGGHRITTRRDGGHQGTYRHALESTIG
jgi:hypothetical protein